MKHEVYSVRDGAVGAYLPPFFQRSRGEAIRSFISAFENKEHQFSKYPEHYVLYQLGFFDDVSGELEYSPEFPMKVLSGHEAISGSVEMISK